MKNLLKIAAIWCVLTVLLCSCENETSPTAKPAPNAPTGLSANTITDTTITVSWKEVSGAVQYHVYTGTTAGNLTRRGSPTATSYLIQGLTANTTYYIAVSAENETGEGKKTAPITVTTNQIAKPAAPSGLAAGTITSNSIAVSWNSVSGATGYTVYAGTSSDNMTQRGTPATASFTITGLTANTDYYIAVSARNDAGEGAQSSQITATTADTTTNPTLPVAPSGLAAGTITSNSIAVSWNSVSGATGYTVYAGTSSDNMTQRGTPATASFTITGLTANTDYYIAVSAGNDAGEGAQSSPITVKTANSTTNPSLPAAPSGLVSVTNTDTTIAVSWDGVSGATGYRVYAGTVAGDLTLRGSPTATSYLIQGLTANVTYYIEVSAVNEAGESERSAPITVTTNQGVKPATPSDLTIGVVTENSIDVSWKNVDGVSGYKVFAGTTIDDMTLKGSPTGTSFTITGLTANTAYWIAVSALTASSESDQSVSVNTVTKPDVPAGLEIGTITANSITVSWTAVSGVSYTVYAGTSSENMTQRGTTLWDNSFTITGLIANTPYFIAVSAKNASGESNKTDPITVTTKLAAPSGLAANPIAASNTIQLSWNGVVGANSYNVYRSDSVAGTFASIGTTPDRSYNDTGITPGDNYYYKVSAFTSGNVEGDLSSFIGGRIPTTTKAIETFGFVDFPSVNGNINGPNISVTVPNIVNLTTLVPTIKHNGKSISPADGMAQDFTTPKQYRVTADDGTYQDYTVTVTSSNTTLATAFTWINSNASYERTYTIVAQASESLAPVTVNPSYNVNIILSGGTTEKTISLSSNGSLFTVSYGTLTLENNITLSGRSANTASLVKVNSYGKLVMKTGSKIQNNTVATANNTDAFGGGVYINGGTFTMDGGTISGNKVQAGTSGSYSSSNDRARGGGVYLNTGTFTMNGGTISNNTAYSAYYPSAGGGVYVAPFRTFTMNGGTISGNTAESSSILATSYTYGGGVYVNNSTFTMTGGTISGNTAKTASYCYGGGVYVGGNVTFTKTGGTIYGSNASPTTLQNTAKNTDSGHAVYVYLGSSSFIMKRNTTAGTTVNMDSGKTGSAGGWE